MRRKGNLYQHISTYENLCLAYRKAARGKQDRQEVIGFRNNFTVNIRKLQDEIIRHQPDIGHYYFFMVHDPKPRSICAASFPERVLHHAIMNICEPVLESYSIFDSYACRKNKGNRKALIRAQHFSRKYSWYLKLDIRKYFDSIDHGCMLELLGRRFKDRQLLELFEKLLATYQAVSGKGLPIGNLISQHLANFYMGVFDHWVKEQRLVKGYLRYMDDFLLFGREKRFLQNELQAVAVFLKTKLKLDLKDPIQLNRCGHGIPYLGYRVFPHTIALSSSSRKRFVDKFIVYQQNMLQGKWTEAELARHMEPLVEFTRFASADSFRRKIINDHGVVS